MVRKLDNWVSVAWPISNSPLNNVHENLLVHDWNDETPVAVGRQELQVYEVIDEAVPVSVGQVNCGTDHGFSV